MASHSNKNYEATRLYVCPFSKPRNALFLDRDGVVIEDVHYICDPDQVQLCPGSRELIAQARAANCPVVLITNQSGIQRGFFSWSDFDRVNKRMQELLGKDAPIAAILANGYGPDAPADSWRKPSPRMLFEASNLLNLDLRNSLLIGDRLTDLKAGVAAGVDSVFHVMTGYGSSERPAIIEWSQKLDDMPGFPGRESNTFTKVEFVNGLGDFPFSAFYSNNFISK